MDCYRRYSPGAERCLTCKMAHWCRDAGDPPLLSGPDAGPTGDNAEYEYAVAVTPEPKLTTAEANQRLQDASQQIGQMFCEFARVCQRNPDRIAAVVFRLAGDSYAAIGQASARGAKSKQAVHKDVNRIAAACPALGNVLRLRYRQTDDSRALNERLAEAFAKRRPGARLTGPDGLYAELAKEFGIRSWNAARVRLQEMVDGLQKHTTESTPSG